MKIYPVIGLLVILIIVSCSAPVSERSEEDGVSGLKSDIDKDIETPVQGTVQDPGTIDMGVVDPNLPSDVISENPDIIDMGVVDPNLPPDVPAGDEEEAIPGVSE